MGAPRLVLSGDSIKQTTDGVPLVQNILSLRKPAGKPACLPVSCRPHIGAGQQPEDTVRWSEGDII